MSLAVGKPTLIALACVLIFTAYSVMPVLQCMAEQKAIGEGYLGPFWQVCSYSLFRESFFF